MIKEEYWSFYSDDLVAVAREQRFFKMWPEQKNSAIQRSCFQYKKDFWMMSINVQETKRYNMRRLACYYSDS